MSGWFFILGPNLPRSLMLGGGRVSRIFRFHHAARFHITPAAVGGVEAMAKLSNPRGRFAGFYMALFLGASAPVSLGMMVYGLYIVGARPAH